MGLVTESMQSTYFTDFSDKIGFHITSVLDIILGWVTVLGGYKLVFLLLVKLTFFLAIILSWFFMCWRPWGIFLCFLPLPWPILGFAWILLFDSIQTCDCTSILIGLITCFSGLKYRIHTFVYTMYFWHCCTTTLSLWSSLNKISFLFSFMYIVIPSMSYFLLVKEYRNDLMRIMFIMFLHGQNFIKYHIFSFI